MNRRGASDPPKAADLFRGVGERVEVSGSNIECVMTRFGLRSRRDVFWTRREYRRLEQEIASVSPPGLLHAALLSESRTALISLSFWSDVAAIPVFGSLVPAHVAVARNVFGRVNFDFDRGPEVWSARWRLVAISNNHDWPGLEIAPATERETPTSALAL